MISCAPIFLCQKSGVKLGTCQNSGTSKHRKGLQDNCRGPQRTSRAPEMTDRNYRELLEGIKAPVKRDRKELREQIFSSLVNERPSLIDLYNA